MAVVATVVDEGDEGRRGRVGVRRRRAHLRDELRARRDLTLPVRWRVGDGRTRPAPAADEHALACARQLSLYVTPDQLRWQARYHNGSDLRRKPYTLFRVRVDARPALLQ